MNIQVALFGIHKLLSQTLEILERAHTFPRVVIFPDINSEYHQQAEAICRRNSVDFLRPHSVKDPSFVQQLENFGINRIVVAGYHQIFPSTVLSLATEGAVNCHGGLLPEERGPIPWKWAVYENKPFTGVTFHLMTARVDEGEILLKKRIDLDPDETSESLFEKVANTVAETVPRFFRRELMREYDRNADTTEKEAYRGQVPEELTVFDLSQTAGELHRRVKAFSPRPGVFLKQENQTILIRKTAITDLSSLRDALIFKAADKDIAVIEYELLYPEAP